MVSQPQRHLTSLERGICYGLHFILHPSRIERQDIDSMCVPAAWSQEVKNGRSLTCNSPRLAGAFASCHEHHIALTCIGIVVFDEEELVHAVILERRDLDHGANGASETSFDDEVLFTADLEGGKVKSSVNNQAVGRSCRELSEEGR